MSSFVAAVVQLRSGPALAANVEATVQGIEEAAALGAAYIQTPEMTSFFSQGREAYLAAARFEAEDEALPVFRAQAKRFSCYLHVGSMPILRSDGLIANRGFLLGPDGDVLARYDKIHMFDVDLGHGETYHESATYAAGHEAFVVKMPFATLGMGICYDLRFAHLFRAMAQAGADLLSVPAAFTRKTGEAHWQVLLRARAIETASFVVAAGQGGAHPHGRETYGHSQIINPWGEVLVELGEDVGVAVAEIDTKQAHDQRRTLPSLTTECSFSVKVV